MSKQTDELRAMADRFEGIGELAQRVMGLKGRARKEAIAKLRKAVAETADVLDVPRPDTWA